jgi:hypothetical protein
MDWCLIKCLIGKRFAGNLCLYFTITIGAFYRERGGSVFHLPHKKFEDVNAGTCGRFATVPFRAANSSDRTELSIAVVATPLREPSNIGN